MSIRYHNIIIIHCDVLLRPHTRIAAAADDVCVCVYTMPTRRVRDVVVRRHRTSTTPDPRPGHDDDASFLHSSRPACRTALYTYLHRAYTDYCLRVNI